MKTLIKFSTISLLITTNFILSLPNARSQNIIPNGGFENLNKISCGGGDESTNFCSSDQNSCSQRTVDPFKNGGIQNWSSAVGSPQLNTPNCVGRTDAIDNHAAFLTSNATGILNIEGIYQEGINFKPNEYYTISLKYKSINNAKIVVKLATGLTNVTTNGSALPAPTTSQLVIEDDSNIPSSWTTLTIPNFQPNDFYNQLLIYADPNGTNISSAKVILVDEVSILKSCCLSNKTYDNLFNPPSIYVQDFIRFNSNITFNNNSNSYFTAKNEILLANNTTIDGVDAFIAQAEDCLAKKVEFYADRFMIRTGLIFKVL